MLQFLVYLTMFIQVNNRVFTTIANSGYVPVPLENASQSSTEGDSTASLAIDKNPSTSSQTEVKFNETIWFRVNFSATHCVHVVRLKEIVSSDTPHLNWRMQHTNLRIINSKTGLNASCGKLEVEDNKLDYTVKCTNEVCGDMLELMVRHLGPKMTAEGADNTGRYTFEGGIRLAELEVYSLQCPGGTMLVGGECALPGI